MALAYCEHGNRVRTGYYDHHLHFFRSMTRLQVSKLVAIDFYLWCEPTVNITDFSFLFEGLFTLVSYGIHF